MFPRGVPITYLGRQSLVPPWKAFGCVMETGQLTQHAVMGVVVDEQVKLTDFQTDFNGATVTGKYQTASAVFWFEVVVIRLTYYIVTNKVLRRQIAS